MIYGIFLEYISYQRPLHTRDRNGPHLSKATDSMFAPNRVPPHVFLAVKIGVKNMVWKHR